MFWDHVSPKVGHTEVQRSLAIIIIISDRFYLASAFSPAADSFVFQQQYLVMFWDHVRNWDTQKPSRLLIIIVSK